MPPKKKAAPALTKVVKSRYDLQIIDEEASSSSDTLTSDQEEKDKRVKTRKSKAVARENALPSNQVTSMENTVKHSVLEALMDPKAAETIQKYVQIITDPILQELKVLKEENEKQAKKIRSLESKLISNKDETVMEISENLNIKESLQAQKNEIITNLSQQLETLTSKLQELDGIKSNIATIEKQNEQITQEQTQKSYADALNVKEAVKEVITQQTTQLKPGNQKEQHNCIQFKRGARQPY